MAKTKVLFSDLLALIRDEKTYADVRKAVAESGSPDVGNLLHHVDMYAAIKGIGGGAALSGEKQNG